MQPLENVTCEWMLGWYDGVIEAIVRHDGELCYAAWTGQFESYNDPRTYEVYKLNPEQQAHEQERHEAWLACETSEQREAFYLRFPPVGECPDERYTATILGTITEAVFAGVKSR